MQDGGIVEEDWDSPVEIFDVTQDLGSPNIERGASAVLCATQQVCIADASWWKRVEDVHGREAKLDAVRGNKGGVRGCSCESLLDGRAHVFHSKWHSVQRREGGSIEKKLAEVEHRTTQSGSGKDGHNVGRR